MNQDPQALIQHFGVLGMIAVLVGGLVAALKTDRANTVLVALHVKPIPKLWLPWIALALGAVSAVVTAKIQGQAWQAAFLQGIGGLFAGALAVAGNEAPVESAKAAFAKQPPANDNDADDQAA
jgi:C4-dicarboxylate transporter